MYLVISCLLVGVWLRWMWRRGLSAAWLFVFALMPNPMWVTISISTDLVFALIFAGFYLAYFSYAGRGRILLWSVFLVLTLLTRPNGVSVLLFVIADALLLTTRSVRINRGILVCAAAPLLVGVVFFIGPYFSIFVVHSMDITYFGFSQREFLEGLYESLPFWLDQPISWLSLAGAKLIYFVGIRPSYGEIPALFLILRGAAGIILLPGLLYLFWKADWRLRLFVGLYLLPIFLGASQDRYNLPIQPLLFFFGALALQDFWKRWAGRGGTVEGHA
jgi:hypothetical protein